MGDLLLAVRAGEWVSLERVVKVTEHCYMTKPAVGSGRPLRLHRDRALSLPWETELSVRVRGGTSERVRWVYGR